MKNRRRLFRLCRELSGTILLSRRDKMLVEIGKHPLHPTVPLGTECDTPTLIFRAYGTKEVG